MYYSSLKIYIDLTKLDRICAVCKDFADHKNIIVANDVNAVVEK